MVDAAMRCLWACGWIHQSVRMVAASFLVEYLGISWVEGARWFHDTLVDADIAINAMMWQVLQRQFARGYFFSTKFRWNSTKLCSCVRTPDAAASTSGTSCCPLKQARRMRPVTFAADGCPNSRFSPTSAPPHPPPPLHFFRHIYFMLRNLPSRRFLHTPWRAPPAVLSQARVQLGVTYPHRVIEDLAAARRITVRSCVLCCPLFLDIVSKRLPRIVTLIHQVEWALEARRSALHMNDSGGYDLIALPSGRTTRVFTKEEFRIGGGGVVKGNKKGKKSKPNTTKLPPAAGGGEGGGRGSAADNKLANHTVCSEKGDARFALSGKASRAGSEGKGVNVGRGGRGAAALTPPGL
jgi:hypothetical protein